MELTNKYSAIQLIKKLVGKKVRFTSDCELFQNFDVTGKVMSYYVKGTEILFKTKIGNKTIDIGSNMKNLKFELKL